MPEETELLGADAAQSAEANPINVPVGLGERSYTIAIGRGVLAQLADTIKKLAPQGRVGIIADETVWSLHGQAMTSMLDAARIGWVLTTVPPGEQSKCFAQTERICDAMIDARLERGDLVIAFGGGVTGDLAGFCASIIRRGMDFIQVPTTLLSQVDSSVGGKTGIDMPQGKNLVGCFHQPRAVLADTALLDTLSPREFRAGYAEVAKYGLLGDEPFFTWLETHWQSVFKATSERDEAVAVSCRAKAAIVEQDEREAGVRALLNLGHTFGHAFEAATGYSDKLLHGEAIAIGMALAFRYSVAQGHCAEADCARAVRHFKHVGLPTELAAVPGGLPDADGLLELMAQDKKVERGALTLILVRGIGQAYVHKNASAVDLRTFLIAESKRP